MIMKKTIMFIFALPIFFNFAFAEIKMSDFADIKTIESSFEIKKFLTIAQEPLVSTGKFYFKRPQFLKWEYNKPFNYGFIINEDRTLTWNDNNGKKDIKDISNQQSAKAMIRYLYAFIAMDEKEISKTYEMEFAEGELILYPKNRSKDQDIDKIIIKFAEEIKAVKEVVILSRNGDKTAISFSNTTIDGEMSDDVFKI